MARAGGITRANSAVAAAAWAHQGHQRQISRGMLFTTQPLPSASIGFYTLKIKEDVYYPTLETFANAALQLDVQKNVGLMK